jgi:hypothetical protein
MVLSVTGLNWLAGSFGSVRSTAGNAGVQFVYFSCGQYKTYNCIKYMKLKMLKYTL